MREVVRRSIHNMGKGGDGEDGMVRRYATYEASSVGVGKVIPVVTTPLSSLLPHPFSSSLTSLLSNPHEPTSVLYYGVMLRGGGGGQQAEAL